MVNYQFIIKILTLVYTFIPYSFTNHQYLVDATDLCDLPYKFSNSINILQNVTILIIHGEIINKEDNEKIKFEAKTFRDDALINLFRNDKSDPNLYKFSIEEPYSYDHLIFTNEKFKDCKFFLKRIDDGILSGYDFRIDYRNRKQSIEYGIEVLYKNKANYENFVSEYNSLMFILGDKKVGKTWFTSRITDTIDISPDDTVNTNGFSGVFSERHRSIFVDTEGLDTPLDTIKLFNITSKFNINEYNQEMENNSKFRRIIREAFTDSAKVIGLIVDQNTMLATQYINELVRKYGNSKFLTVIHNYRSLEVRHIQERVDKDILSRSHAKEIPILDSRVKTYLDNNFDGKGISILHHIFVNETSSSIDYNLYTFKHILQKMKEHQERTDPIRNFVQNLNMIIKDNAAIKDENINCVEIEILDENKDLIKFPNQDVCNIWNNVKTIEVDYPFRIYLKNSLLFVEIIIPGLYSRKQLEGKPTITNRENNKFSFKFDIKINNIEKINQNERDTFLIRDVQIKSEILIEHEFSFITKKNWDFLNEHEALLKGGILTIMFPYSKI